MDLIQDGRLVRKITGTICNNLGVLRGITPLASSKLTHHRKATRVYYYKLENFIFYGDDLPLDIEGNRFEFKERYIGDNANGLPVNQRLTVFFGKEKRIFEFKKD